MTADRYNAGKPLMHLIPRHSLLSVRRYDLGSGTYINQAIDIAYEALYEMDHCRMAEKLVEVLRKLGVTPTDVARVLTFGAQKYAAWNWSKGLSFTDTFNSMLRHLDALANGQTDDPESGLPHKAHIGCNIYFLLDFSKRPNMVEKFDDRRDKLYSKDIHDVTQY